MKKKFLSTLLAVCMMLSLLPTTVFADEPAGGKAAKIGTTEYDTLEEAIEAAENGSIITLIRDIVLDPTHVKNPASDGLEPVITIDKDLTLDLSGHSITWDCDKISNIEEEIPYTFAFFDIQSSVVITGNGTIDAEALNNNSYGINVNGGSLTIENGTFYGAMTAIQVQTGSLIIHDGTFGLAKTITDFISEYPSYSYFTKYVINAIDDNWQNKSAAILITGGTFPYNYSSYPEGADTTYLAPGYELNESGDGTYSVKMNDAVSTQVLNSNGSIIGAYTTLQDALTAAQSGDTVVLLDNITTGSVISISDSIILDLKNHTIHSSGNSVFTIDSDAVVNIKNGTLEGDTKGIWCSGGTLTLTNAAVNSGEGYAIQMTGAATVTVDQDSVVASKEDSGIYLDGQANEKPVLHVYGTVTGGQDKKGEYCPAVDGTSYDPEDEDDNKIDPADVYIYPGADIRSSGDIEAIYYSAPGTLAISGGTNSLYIDSTASGANISITGGTFNGAIAASDGVSKFISGGAFSAQPNASYIADGCTAVYNPEGDYQYTVGKSVDNVTLASPISLVPGGTQQLTPVFDPADAVNTDVTWTSSDVRVASVDADGLVTAVAPGTATITVTAEDKSYTADCIVKVEVGGAVKIGAVGYDSLTAAVAAVTSGQTITLLQDNTEAVTVDRPVSFTLDANGFRFTGSVAAGGDCILTQDGQTYTSTLAAAKIGSTTYATLAEAAAAVEDYGTITLVQDCAETVIIDRAVIFTLDVNGNNFTGAVKAGDGFVLSTVNSSYLVMPKAEDSVNVVVQTTVESAVDDAIPDAAKDSVQTSMGNISTGGLTQALNTAATSKVSDDTSTQAVEQLREELDNSELAAASVTIVARTTIEIRATGYENSENAKSFTVDITPRYQLIATTDPENIRLTGTEKNAVTIEQGKAEINDEITLTIPLPIGLSFTGTDNIFVKHTKDDGTVYNYPGTLQGNAVCFTNPGHGFSTFSISQDDRFATVQFVKDTAAAETVTYTPQQSNDPLPTDSRSGYTFNGWRFDTPDAGDNVYKVMSDTLLTYLNDYRLSSDTVPITAHPDFTRSYTSGGGGGGSSSYSVNVSSVSNGKVSISPRNASKGTTVTITATPNSGYEVSTVVVTDKNGNQLTVTDKGNGTYTFVMPSGAVDVKVTFQKSEAPAAFDDVAADAWYAGAVAYMCERGLMAGTAQGVFSPDVTLSRSMIAQILYSLEGKPSVSGSGFDDVAAGAWYYSAITWAAANGVVSGYGDGMFGPDDNITREQLMTILYAYAKRTGLDLESQGSISYLDRDSISDWAYEAACWCTANGIVSGKAGNLLDPNGFATRAEAAQMIQNFCLVLEAQ